MPQLRKTPRLIQELLDVLLRLKGVGPRNLDGNFALEPRVEAPQDRPERSFPKTAPDCISVDRAGQWLRIVDVDHLPPSRIALRPECGFILGVVIPCSPETLTGVVEQTLPGLVVSQEPLDRSAQHLIPSTFASQERRPFLSWHLASPLEQLLLPHDLKSKLHSKVVTRH